MDCKSVHCQIVTRFFAHGNPIYRKSFTRRFHGDQKEKNDSSSSLPIDPLLIPDFFGNNVNPLAYIFVKSIPN
jgi:hypothetical protein